MKKVFYLIIAVFVFAGCTKDGNNSKKNKNGLFQCSIEGDANIQFHVEGGCDKVFAHYVPGDASSDFYNILLVQGFDGKQTLGITLYFKGDYPSNPIFQLGIDGGGANAQYSGMGQFMPDELNNPLTFYSTDDRHFGTCTITEYDQVNQRISGTFSFDGQLYNNGAMASGATSSLKGSFADVPIVDLTDPSNPKGPCNNSQGNSLGTGNSTSGGNSGAGGNGGNGAGGSGSGSANKGQVMFWASSDLGCGNITVSCNGSSAQVSAYSSTAPSCGTIGAATFSLSPGTYNYSASCTGGLTWSGTATVTANGCNKIQLVQSGGSSTGGGFFANNTVTFWIASDLGCGNITVNCNGTSRTITSYYSSGAPACDAAGTATFVLPTSQDSYSYTASCSGLTWKGTVTVSPFTSSNPCIKIQLTD
jgi:hypothetical protein